MTHDYKRNGTATLFAALNAANGEVIGLCMNGIATRNGSGFCALHRSRHALGISTYT